MELPLRLFLDARSRFSLLAGEGRLSVAAAPRLNGRSAVRKISLKPVRQAFARLARPVRAPLANLASVPLHAAGLGVFDFAAFHLPDPGFWGWAVTAASLVWLEHVIADEQ